MKSETPQPAAAQPRYFCHVDGFKDGTQYLRLDPDGKIVGVAKDGREWPAFSYDAALIAEKVSTGIWHELNHVQSEVQPPAAATQETDYKALYFELLFAVGNKFEGETRHQTALRYIRRAEEPNGIAITATQERV